MKPHEETWRANPEGVIESDTDMVAVVLSTHANTHDWGERAALIAAAPEMARRLLAHFAECEGCGGTGLTSIRSPEGRDAVPCPTCENDRAALAKAGVLP